MPLWLRSKSKFSTYCDVVEKLLLNFLCTRLQWQCKKLPSIKLLLYSLKRQEFFLALALSNINNCSQKFKCNVVGRNANLAIETMINYVPFQKVLRHFLIFTLCQLQRICPQIAVKLHKANAFYQSQQHQWHLLVLSVLNILVIYAEMFWITLVWHLKQQSFGMNKHSIHSTIDTEKFILIVIYLNKVKISVYFCSKSI